MFQSADQIVKKLKVTSLLNLLDGSLTLPIQALITTQTKTFVAADLGKIWFASYAGASTFTLPAIGSAGRGKWIIVGQTVGQDLTVNAAAADTIITINDLDADGVAFTTSSEKIGALVLFMSYGGTKWFAVNLSTSTMTVTT